MKKGDFVLKEIRAPIHNLWTKYCLNWGGVFLIKKILYGGTLKLINLNGIDFKEPTNLN